MKRNIYALLITGVLALVLVYSCKKKDTTTTTTAQLNSQISQFNNDENYYKSESDQSDDDINNNLSSVPSMGGRMEQGYSSALCGATIDTNGAAATKTIKFNFDGVTSCFIPSRVRSGQIIVQLTTGTQWKNAGSVLTITYNNFKVVRQSDNASITFNGTKTLENVNGNNWINFLLGKDTLKYRERAYNIQLSFGNGANATWNSARVTQWTYTPSTVNVTFTCNGDTTLNGYTGVSSWGVNRFGNSFTTNYNSPVVSDTYCGLWRFLGGVLVNHVSGADYTLTLGVDTNGNPITNLSNCAYGFKVGWVDSQGKQQSAVFSY